MPRQNKNKPRQRFLFWMTSSRGFDHKAVLEFPADFSKQEIVEYCEEYATIVCPKRSETCYHYGWEKIPIRTRAQILRDYRKACVIKNKAEDKWKRLAAELNPRSWDL